MATVAITHNRNNIEAAVIEALNQLPLEHMVSGKRVTVKPNDTWASSEDKTAVTQPETLRGVLRHLTQFHPRELLVTGGAGAAACKRPLGLLRKRHTVNDSILSIPEAWMGILFGLDVRRVPGSPFAGIHTFLLRNWRKQDPKKLGEFT